MTQITPQELLAQLKEQYQKNAEEATWALRYPDASREEKLAHAKIQDDTYNAVQATFETFKSALTDLPEPERQQLAKEAMQYISPRPISPFMKKRLAK